jgi:hypothetical protein
MSQGFSRTLFFFTHQLKEVRMYSKTVTARAPQPRNSVVLAIVRRAANTATRQHRNARRATRHQAKLDLAQRVRESGEW